MQEDIPEDLALRLIGESKAIPNARYQLITTVYEVVVVQYDLSCNPTDEGYVTEYTLEEEHEKYEDNPIMSMRTITVENDKPVANWTARIAIFMGGVFLIGLALLLYMITL